MMPEPWPLVVGRRVNFDSSSRRVSFRRLRNALNAAFSCSLLGNSGLGGTGVGGPGVGPGVGSDMRDLLLVNREACLFGVRRHEAAWMMRLSKSKAVSCDRTPN